MKTVFERIIKRFGEKVLLAAEDNRVSVQAFLQPVTSLDKRYYGDVVTEAGIVSDMRYLYLGPTEPDVSQFDTLVCRDREFEAVSCEIVYAGKEPVCCWAVLREINN